MEWDTSDLLTEGRLRVKEASSINNVQGDEVTVWPVKVQQELNVSVPVRTQVAVFNLAGSLVNTLVAQPGNTTIDMAALPKGIYLVKVGGRVFRIVKA